jgi:hypothetical protein
MTIYPSDCSFNLHDGGQFRNGVVEKQRLAQWDQRRGCPDVVHVQGEHVHWPTHQCHQQATHKGNLNFDFSTKINFHTRLIFFAQPGINSLKSSAWITKIHKCAILQSFSCHRMFLSRLSPVFETMITESENTDGSYYITISPLDPNLFQLILKYALFFSR